MKTIFTLFLLLFSLAALAQDEKPKTPEKPKRRLSFSQLFKEIEECKDTIYRLENAVLVLNENTDKRFYMGYDSASLAGFDTIFVKPELKFTNIEIQTTKEIFLSRMKFQRALMWEGVAVKSENTWPTIKFQYCHFQHFVKISKLKQLGFYLDYSYFIQNIELSDLEDMNTHIYASQLAGHGYFSNIRNSVIHINNSTLKGCNKFLRSESVQVNLGSSIFTSEVHDGFYDVLQPLAIDIVGNNMLNINNCYFKISKLPKIYTEMLISNANRLTMQSDTVEIRTVFTDNISRDFNVSKCIFKNHVNFEGVELPQYAFKAAYWQLKDHISFSYDYGKKFYSHKDTFVLADDDKYQNVLQIYARFYDIYKRSQDTKSAEECYVDMKTFMLRKQEYEYRQDPNPKNYVDWQFNQFIGYFSVYGTDSALALIHIFEWIGIFAVFYFFFPSEEDNLYRKRVFREIERLSLYLTSNKQLSELHLEETQNELQDLYVFRASLKNYQGRIPWVLWFLGKPFYWFSHRYYKMQLWFWKHSEFSFGAWEHHSPIEKVKVAVFVSFYLLFFLIWGVIMRIFNAVMLSLNVFTTLGYGEMQARGWLKYLAVLEGAVGWFLLTVFSASLVSQLLQ